MRGIFWEQDAKMSTHTTCILVAQSLTQTTEHLLTWENSHIKLSKTHTNQTPSSLKRAEDPLDIRSLSRATERAHTANLPARLPAANKVPSTPTNTPATRQAKLTERQDPASVPLTMKASHQSRRRILRAPVTGDHSQFLQPAKAVQADIY